MSKVYTLGDSSHQLRFMRGAHISTNIAQEAVSYIVNNNPYLLFEEKFTIVKVNNVSQFNWDDGEGNEANVLDAFTVGSNGYVVIADDDEYGQSKIWAELTNSEIVCIKTNENGIEVTDSNYELTEYDIASLITAPAYNGEELLGGWYTVGSTKVWAVYPGFKFARNTAINSVNYATGVTSVTFGRTLNNGKQNDMFAVERSNGQVSYYGPQTSMSSLVVSRVLKVESVSPTTDLGKSGAANPPEGYGGSVYNGAFVKYHNALGHTNVSRNSTWSSGTANMYQASVPTTPYIANGSAAYRSGVTINHASANLLKFGYQTPSVADKARFFAKLKFASSIAELTPSSNSFTTSKKSAVSVYGQKVGMISDSDILSTGFSLSIPSNAYAFVYTVNSSLDSYDNLTGKCLFNNVGNQTITIPAQDSSVCAIIIEVRVTNANNATITMQYTPAPAANLPYCYKAAGVSDETVKGVIGALANSNPKYVFERGVNIYEGSGGQYDFTYNNTQYTLWQVHDSSDYAYASSEAQDNGWTFVCTTWSGNDVAGLSAVTVNLLKLISPTTYNGQAVASRILGGNNTLGALTEQWIKINDLIVWFESMPMVLSNITKGGDQFIYTIVNPSSASQYVEDTNHISAYGFAYSSVNTLYDIPVFNNSYDINDLFCLAHAYIISSAAGSDFQPLATRPAIYADDAYNGIMFQHWIRFPELPNYNTGNCGMFANAGFPDAENMTKDSAGTVAPVQFVCQTTNLSLAPGQNIGKQLGYIDSGKSVAQWSQTSNPDPDIPWAPAYAFSGDGGFAYINNAMWDSSTKVYAVAHDNDVTLVVKAFVTTNTNSGYVAELVDVVEKTVTAGEETIIDVNDFNGAQQQYCTFVVYCKGDINDLYNTDITLIGYSWPQQH